MTENKVRRDLFSVQERGNGFQHWCHTHICRSLLTAKRLKKGCVPLLGFTHEVRIVHPTQVVVDAYVAAGNEIHA